MYFKQFSLFSPHTEWHKPAISHPLVPIVCHFVVIWVFTISYLDKCVYIYVHKPDKAKIWTISDKNPLYKVLKKDNLCDLKKRHFEYIRIQARYHYCYKRETVLFPYSPSKKNYYMNRLSASKCDSCLRPQAIVFHPNSQTKNTLALLLHSSWESRCIIKYYNL